MSVIEQRRMRSSVYYSAYRRPGSVHAYCSNAEEVLTVALKTKTRRKKRPYLHSWSFKFVPEGDYLFGRKPRVASKCSAVVRWAPDTGGSCCRPNGALARTLRFFKEHYSRSEQSTIFHFLKSLSPVFSPRVHQPFILSS